MHAFANRPKATWDIGGSSTPTPPHPVPPARPRGLEAWVHLLEGLENFCQASLVWRSQWRVDTQHGTATLWPAAASLMTVSIQRRTGA